jgi:hypothetical protein
MQGWVRDWRVMASSAGEFFGCFLVNLDWLDCFAAENDSLSHAHLETRN